ncbi:MAG: hypothetical protein NT164_06635 [Verrucomicrobiae bacterium]|nr:hypothetical protein [Verrucomicrobiae bacterium]
MLAFQSRVLHFTFETAHVIKQEILFYKVINRAIDSLLDSSVRWNDVRGVVIVDFKIDAAFIWLLT